MNTLTVKNLCKRYPAFSLEGVSFSLEPGKITGFIGKNGAGKTTTLKSIFDFVHPDSGEALFFGLPFLGNELEIKQRTGFVLGGFQYYAKKKIKTITAVTKGFYSGWDNTAYTRYTKMFQLDENKTPSELSSGMQVKYALALALSHRAELLVLDEPTSGLDPVSRDELLEIFMQLCDEGVTILFSTHITSDLDKCADNIIYIQNGGIIAEEKLEIFVDSYRIVEFLKGGEVPQALEEKIIGRKRTKNGFSALIKTGDVKNTGVPCAAATLEEIMVHIEKEEGAG